MSLTMEGQILSMCAFLGVNSFSFHSTETNKKSSFSHAWGFILRVTKSKIHNHLHSQGHIHAALFTVLHYLIFHEPNLYILVTF